MLFTNMIAEFDRITIVEITAVWLIPLDEALRAYTGLSMPNRTSDVINLAAATIADGMFWWESFKKSFGHGLHPYFSPTERAAIRCNIAGMWAAMSAPRNRCASKSFMIDNSSRSQLGEIALTRISVIAAVVAGASRSRSMIELSCIMARSF
jgi:hypothetical protein